MDTNTDFETDEANLDAERVEYGAKWLDGIKPGWAHLVNVETLNIESITLCIAGQVFADNNNDTDGFAFASDHVPGFDCCRMGMCGFDGIYKPLWIDQINARINA